MKNKLLLFFKKNPANKLEFDSEKQSQPDNHGFIAAKSAGELLADERRQTLIDRIWEQTSVSKDSFEKLYRQPIERFAELVQEFPASENHHHSYLGGMLDHGLELVLYSLRLRQGYLLPIGATTEEQAQHAGIWTAATAYGGLMHDTGKILCDIRVQLKDGTTWNAWNGPITQPYRFRYIKGRDYKLHNAAASILCSQILGSEVLSWLATNQPVWSSLLYLLSGDYAQAGALAEIVSKADRTSTAMNIGANPEKALQAPPASLQSHLIRGLRELFTNEEFKLKINVPGAAGWLTQDGLWLVSKAVADKLRAFLLSQGVDKVPGKNSALFDELQSHRLIEPNNEGNAIWKATVTDGQWQQEFTFLRVKPSLIWEAEEYPERFRGTVSWDGNHTDNTTNTSQTQVQVPVTAQEQTKQTEPSAKPVTVSSPIKNNNDDVDDVLALFDMPELEAEPVETNPQPQPNDADIELTQAIAEKEAEHTDDASTAPPAASVSPNTSKKPKKHDHGNINANLNLKLTQENIGQNFIEWLKTSIINRNIYINDSKAPLHIVDGNAFLVTPTIFQRFTEQFPEIKQFYNEPDGKHWRLVQRQFENLQLHIKRDDDLNIHRCIVRGPRKSGNVINGYMLPTDILFTFKPQDNPFVTLKQEK